jgi:hypothetical protein
LGSASPLFSLLRHAIKEFAITSFGSSVYEPIKFLQSKSRIAIREVKKEDAFFERCSLTHLFAPSANRESYTRALPCLKHLLKVPQIPGTLE